MNTIRRTLTSKSLAIGLAIFSMFFGAGNVIFPLALGQYAGDKNLYAIAGLILTATVMPIAGVISMILFDGSYHNFFGRLGKAPGFILALIIICLLGPLGSTPRCIALSYTTIKSTFPGISPIFFSALSCALIFVFTIRRNYILTLLGWVLTPLLLFSVLTIIGIGLTATPDIQMIKAPSTHVFFHGLKEGYNTMDLLAAFFFSSTILQTLKLNQNSTHGYVKTALKASLIGGLLLALIYLGFSYLASFHGSSFLSYGKDELLAAITLKIAGSKAGPLVCITIALACLTTAIALISSFTDFIYKELCKEKVRYDILLSIALLVTFFVSTFEFTSISAFLGPILEICYPGLIVLTILNILYRLKNFKPVKTPVFIVFILSTYLYLQN